MNGIDVEQDGNQYQYFMRTLDDRHNADQTPTAAFCLTSSLSTRFDEGAIVVK